MLLAALVCGVCASLFGASHAWAFLGDLFAPDIELISVELVDQKDQVEMDFFGPDTPRPPRPLLKVRLRTAPDIHEYIEQNEYSLVQFASTCEGDAMDERQTIEGPSPVSTTERATSASVVAKGRRSILPFPSRDRPIPPSRPRRRGRHRPSAFITSTYR